MLRTFCDRCAQIVVDAAFANPYAADMGILVSIAVLCCVGLLGLGGILGYTVSCRQANTGTLAFVPAGSAVRTVALMPMPFFVHPRMDLASGSIPCNQTVNLVQRRIRQESSETLGIADSTLGLNSNRAAAAFETVRRTAEILQVLSPAAGLGVCA